MKKENNTAQKKKLPFGRNIFTFVFGILVVLILTCIIYTIYSYSSTYSNNKFTPFTDESVGKAYESSSYKLDDVTRTNFKNFNDFGVVLTCTSYDEDENTGATVKASYKVALYKYENTREIKNGTVDVMICMGADWINFLKYPTSTSIRTLEFNSSEEVAKQTTPTYSRTFSFSGLVDFPAKAKTWPIPVTVDCPNIYLYLSYQYQENGKTLTKSYVLQYSYYDLIPQTGGIIK